MYNFEPVRYVIKYGGSKDECEVIAHDYSLQKREVACDIYVNDVEFVIYRQLDLSTVQKYKVGMYSDVKSVHVTPTDQLALISRTQEEKKQGISLTSNKGDY